MDHRMTDYYTEIKKPIKRSCEMVSKSQEDGNDRKKRSQNSQPTKNVKRFHKTHHYSQSSNIIKTSPPREIYEKPKITESDSFIKKIKKKNHPLSSISPATDSSTNLTKDAALDKICEKTKSPVSPSSYVPPRSPEIIDDNSIEKNNNHQINSESQNYDNSIEVQFSESNENNDDKLINDEPELDLAIEQDSSDSSDMNSNLHINQESFDESFRKNLQKELSAENRQEHSQKDRSPELELTNGNVNEITNYDNVDVDLKFNDPDTPDTPAPANSNDDDDANKNSIILSAEEQHLSLDPLQLPENTIAYYRSKGVTHLMQWQYEALNLPGVLEGSSNLIFSAPTSAGKTLVADTLLLRAVVHKQKKGLIILPYISLANEKVAELEKMLKYSSIQVGGFMGNSLPSGRFPAVNIAVCTIEKANNIINRLIEDKNLENVGVVIVDELHEVGVSERGSILEQTLIKLKMAKEKDGLDLQIVGMSATLPNLNEIATWLKAEPYITDYRPVPLKEMVMIEDKIYEVVDGNWDDKQPLRTFEDFTVKIKDTNPTRPNYVQTLCIETMLSNNGVLVFCSSRDGSQKMAQALASKIQQLKTYKGSLEHIEEAKNKLNEEVLKEQQIKEIIEQLKKCPAKLDPDLAFTIPNGVAFHHAALSMDERDIIESGFKNGSIKVLFATPTLSSGVNLPARRVIISSSKTGRDSLNPLTYRQMKGRAGRKGIDTIGESVFISKQDKSDVQEIRQIVTSGLKRIESKAISLSNPNDESSQILINETCRRLALEPFATGMIETYDEFKVYMNHTLFAFQMRPLNDEEIREILNKLTTSEKGGPEATICRIVDQEGQERYVASKIGSGILASSFPPDEAFRLKKELEIAMNGISLNCDLHILFYVIPDSNVKSAQINWQKFFDVLEKIENDSEFKKEKTPKKIVMGLLNIDIGYVGGQLNRYQRNDDINEKKIRHVKFYYALALNEIMKERTLRDVSDEFGINRGELQMLQQRSSSYCGMLAILCKKLGWEIMSMIIKMFQDRLYFGISQDLIELMSITCLNAQMARCLHTAGFTEIKQIAHSSKFDIEKVLINHAPENSDLKRNWISSKCRSMSDSEISELIIKEARLVIEENAGAKLQWDDDESSLDVQTADTTITNPSRSSQNSQEFDKTKMRAKYINDGLSQIQAPSPSKFIDTNMDSSSQSSIKSSSTDRSRSPKKNSLKRFQPYRSPIKKRSKSRNNNYRKRFLTSTRNKTTNNETTTTTEDITEPSVVFSYGSDSDKSQTKIGDEKQSEHLTTNYSNTTDPFEIEIENMNDDEDDDDVMMNSGALDEIGSDQLTNSDCDRTSKQSSESEFNILSQSPEVLRRNMDVELFDTTDEEYQQNVEDELSTLVSSGSVGNVQKTVNKLNKKLFYDSPYNKKVDERCFQIVDFHASNIRDIIKSEATLKISSRKIDQTSIYSFIDKFRSTDLFIIHFKIEPMIVNEDDFVNKKKQHAQDIRVKAEWLDKIQRMCIIIHDRSDGGKWPKIYCFDTNQTIQLLKKQLTSQKFKFNNNLVTGICYDAKVGFKILKACFEFSDECLKQIYWHDPKIAHWMLNPDANEPESLIDIAKLYLEKGDSDTKTVSFFNKLKIQKQKYKEYEADLKNGKEVKELSDVEAHVSALLIYPVISELKHLLKDKFLYESYINIELPILMVFAKMELNGFTIDRDYMTKSFIEWRNLDTELEDLIHKRLVKEGLKKSNDVHLSVKKPKEVKWYLTKLGLYKKLQETSKSKIPDRVLKSLGTAKEILEKMKQFHPIAGWISDSRKLRHMIETREILVNEMNRLNIKNQVMGTYKHFMATGRIAMVLPNLLGIDKDSKMEIKGKTYKLSLKRVFTAKPGYIIITADFCQLELRILAAISKETNLINCFEAGKDPFRLIAARVNKKPADEIDEFERNSAKQLMYAIIYGQGVKKLMDNLGVDDESIANDFLKEFHSAFPNLNKFVEQSKEFARENGFIETVFARRRYLPNINSKVNEKAKGDERKAVNSRIQGSASDLVKLTMLKIDQELKSSEIDGEFLLQIHDELIFQVRNDDENRKAFIKLLIREMTDCGRVLKTKLEIKVKKGPNWSDLTEIDVKRFEETNED